MQWCACRVLSVCSTSAGLVGVHASRGAIARAVDVRGLYVDGCERRQQAESKQQQLVQIAESQKAGSRQALDRVSVAELLLSKVKAAAAARQPPNICLSLSLSLSEC